MTALQELTDSASALVSPAIRDWKSQGKKVIGFFCSYVPQEILYAGGILPYRVRPTQCPAETPLADVYVSHLNCGFMRSCLQLAYEGKYDFLDGLVFIDSCDHIRRLYDVMRETAHSPFMYLISTPHKTGKEAVTFYRGEIASFRKAVERHFGVEITEAGLSNAIDVYNETRDLLNRLYELRQSETPPLTGAESLSVVLAASSMPREEYNRLLRKLLEELGQRRGVSDYRARLMISGGGGCDDPSPFKMIEDLGGLIVTDTLCFGSRSFIQPAAKGDDLLLSLALSYMNRPACVRMTDKVSERAEFMKTMAQRARVDGIIFQRIRYCDFWGGELLYVRKALEQANIPYLDLEREYRWGAAGQIATRIQAFLERLER